MSERPKRSLGRISRFATLCVAVAVTGATYAGVSSALTPQPAFPNGSSAGSLPATGIPPESSAVVRHMIVDAGDQANVGLNDSSIAQARTLGQTSAGTIFVVPGTNGHICLVLAYAVSCGSAAEAEGSPVIASVYVRDASNRLVGGGVTTTDATSVSLPLDNGTAGAASVVKGGFIFQGQPGRTLAGKEAVK